MTSAFGDDATAIFLVGLILVWAGLLLCLRRTIIGHGVAEAGLH